MNRFRLLVTLSSVLLFLLACSPAKSIPRTWVIPDTPFPFSQPGPYFAGRMELTVIDQSRNNREIRIEIWYPAIKQTKTDGQAIRTDAKPDPSGAPYPLILTEHRTGRWIFEDHLVSHGFIMAIITVPDHVDYLEWDLHMINWPRDFLFSLGQIAAHPPENLKTMINTNHVGVTGYSFGGDISLTLAGVRIDPAAYHEYCKTPPVIDVKFEGWDLYHQLTCKLADKWPQFSAAAGPALTAGSDGLWQPLSDDRIKAVMPMAPTGTWLYGKRGLASVKKPLLLIASTDDEFSPYQIETKFLFSNLGASEKALITFMNQSHMMVEKADVVTKLKHFATAFFGYHLQGRSDLQKFVSQDDISQFKELYWGIAPGK